MPIEVEIGNCDPRSIEIALCHDLLEDTGCTQVILLSKLLELGYNNHDASYIIMGIMSLTDMFTKSSFPELNKFERHKREIDRLSGINPEFQSVKYADLIDNTSSIAKYDLNFASVYLPEKKRLLNVMRAGDIDLLIKCCATLDKAFDILKEHGYTVTEKE